MWYRHYLNAVNQTATKKAACIAKQYYIALCSRLLMALGPLALNGIDKCVSKGRLGIISGLAIEVVAFYSRSFMVLIYQFAIRYRFHVDTKIYHVIDVYRLAKTHKMSV